MSRTVLSLFLHHSMTIFCETQCKINATQENQPYHSNKEHFENPKYFVRSILLISCRSFKTVHLSHFFHNSVLEILAGYFETKQKRVSSSSNYYSNLILDLHNHPQVHVSKQFSSLSIFQSLNVGGTIKQTKIRTRNSL